MQDDLKKKKSLLIYGRMYVNNFVLIWEGTGDKFKRCVVKASSFADL